jgi:uncharacterized protein (DUF1778 family)
VAATTKRTARILLRVTPAEKELIRERAGGTRQVSDYIRRQALSGVGPEIAERAALDRQFEKASARAPGDFAALVERHAQRMPRRSAEILARREMARERAVGSGHG